MTELAPPTLESASPTTMSVGPTERQGWVERKWSARAIGAIAYLVPFIGSVAAAFVLSSLLPAAPSVFIGLLRWVGIATLSTVVLIIVERQTRRLMPLRTLLGLSLAFPDKAPSRFKIAIRTGTTHQLRQRLAEARDGRLGDTPSEAAERLLELVGMLSQHDRLTRGHSERVRAYSQMIGAEMGLSHGDLDRLRWAGLLHDVGKLAIDPDILNKPGKLTAEEFEQIKTHPMEGKALVEPLAGWLGEAARAVWEHHERFDGGGYPQGLAGQDISLAARIVSVADVFDVITSVRSYKLATSPREAREELARCAGTQFDPEVVRAFLALSMGEVRSTMGPLSWLAQLVLLPGALAAQAGPVLATAAVVTAGAAAGTVGVIVDPGPAVVERTEYIATVDDPALFAPPAMVSLGGLDAGGTDAGAAAAAPRPPKRPGDEVSLPADDGTPVVLLTDPTTSIAVANDPEPDGPTSSLPIPPSTTISTTTTDPVQATTTSTTSTTTTSTTTTSTTTTTTTAVTAIDPDEHLYLLGDGDVDQTSSPMLPFGADRPAEMSLPNYDTDRDSFAGLLLKKDGAGINGNDPTKVQRWRTSFDVATRIDDDIAVQLEVAAKGFADKDVHVQMQLLKCARLGCQSLGVGDRTVRNADRFKKATVEFAEIDTVLLPGEVLELRVAILGDSEDDAWLAFGTREYNSRIMLGEAG